MLSQTDESLTKSSFLDKWTNNQDLAFKETLRPGSDIQNWILNRNGWKTGTELSTFLANKKRVLDAGCGNGRVTALLRTFAPKSSEVVGIDLTGAQIAKANLGDIANTTFFEKDLLGDLTDLGKFDFVYCQEVLHHTSNPEGAFQNLVKNCLDKSGTIGIYVYKKKAPMREYADDMLRDILRGKTYEESQELCREITELGKALSETNVKVTVPAVKALEIPAGEYDMQRFIYHFFLKCFWNPDLSMKENVAINYDWYHPQLCSRHTVEEVREWFVNAGLKVTHEIVDYYGITMHGRPC